MNVVNLQPRLEEPVTLVCSACGAEARSACNCGKPYISKAEAATKAIAASPQKSDRSIAKELGVSAMTVNRAREATVTECDSRVGIDGKTRKLRKQAPRGTPMRVGAGFQAPLPPKSKSEQDKARTFERTRLLRELVRVAFSSQRHTVDRAAKLLESRAFKNYQSVDIGKRLHELAEWINAIAEKMS